MSIHLAPLTLTARAYVADDAVAAFNRHDAYSGVCTVTWIGRDEVLVSGYAGYFAATDWRDLQHQLAAQGMRRALAERDGRLHVLFCSRRDCRNLGGQPAADCPDARCLFRSTAGS